jgi:hypothetical protein
VSETDRELCQTLPQLAVFPFSCLPHSLKHLVGMKGVAILDEPLGLPQGLVRGEDHVLGNPVDSRRTVR